jgi:LmbE family N-acetylglucosaminyl deacetylase
MYHSEIQPHLFVIPIRGFLYILVTLTRGEAGETNGICADGVLSAVRGKELRSACKILGIRHLDI